MSPTEQDSGRESFAFYNYCVSFIDLLGQRVALEGQGVLPTVPSEDERKRLIATFRKCIGSIVGLQKDAEEMLEPLLQPNPGSRLRAQLPTDHHVIWDEMAGTKVTTQRWSDGLVSFACLGDQSVKCHMNDVFAIFCLAGAISLMGLAQRRPVRGAIEIAWGIELRPGELYGPAVSRAYEIESEIAQYPRIVVGPEALKFVQSHSMTADQDIYSQNDRGLALHCLEMLVQDADGHWHLHYLGEAFQRDVSHTNHAQLYAAAREFVVEQLTEHRRSQNTKLAFRYSHLLQYFDAHPPRKPV